MDGDGQNHHLGRITRTIHWPPSSPSGRSAAWEEDGKMARSGAVKGSTGTLKLLEHRTTAPSSTSRIMFVVGFNLPRS